MFAAQEQVLNTKLYRKCIQKENITPICRVCGVASEIMGHLTSACKGLTQREYNRRHNRLRVYWELYRILRIKSSQKWFQETPDEVKMSDDGMYEIWWDKSVTATKRMEHNRLDVVII